MPIAITKNQKKKKFGKEMQSWPTPLPRSGYTTLVVLFWNIVPHLVTQILAVEMDQRRAARFVKENFQWTGSVTEMLRSLHWDTLRSHLENLSLGLFKRFNFDMQFQFNCQYFSSQSKGPKTSRSFKAVD